MNMTADRKGNISEDHSLQDRLLAWIYGHAAGRMLIRPFISKRISEFGRSIMESRASAFFVPFFIRSHSIDMDDYEQKKYASFNDFFTRKLAQGARCMNLEKNVWISPCDSRLGVYKIEKGCTFTVKHTRYTAAELLKDKKLAEKFAGGYVWVFRLCADDYHRYVFVDRGTVSAGRRIEGVFHTVNPAANDVFPIYKENTREYCLLKSENFGTVLCMEVGALLVGRIENRQGKKCVERGEEKGNFAFGGSTIILMTQKGQVLPSGDLLRYSKSGIETKVRMGEKIGVKAGHRSRQRFI
ncbi:MAG: phosphatidylserine decarboxylase [Eubacterium sp.]|nr:phosphatidylserine decarboxylase [Eubacterium sp.]